MGRRRSATRGSHGRREPSPFSMPGEGTWVRWKARDAKRAGEWKEVGGSACAKGGHLSAGAKDGSARLEFPFEVSRASKVEAQVLWSPEAERRSARRFPYPFPRACGPTSLTTDGTRVWFCAPATGRVAVLDPGSKEVAGVIDMGGYPVDLTYDEASGKVVVADAAGARVVMIDAAEGTVTGEVAVPERPWSVASAGGRVFVACLEGQALAAIDATRGTVEQVLELGAAPVAVWTDGLERARVHVKLLPNILGPQTLDDELPDRYCYRVAAQREYAEKGSEAPMLELWSAPAEFAVRRRRVTCAASGRVFGSDEDNFLSVSDGAGVGRVDVSPVTAARPRVTSVSTPLMTPARLPFPLRPDRGPAALDRYGKQVLFVSPSAARVGAVDMDSEEIVAAAEVGGYLTDMVVDRERGKVYVCDATGRRLVVFEAEGLRKVCEVALPAMPLSMAMAEGARELVVACRTDKCLAVVDLERFAVTRIRVLPARPYEVHMMRLAPVDRTEDGAADVSERLLLCMSNPTAFEASTLRPIEAEGYEVKAPDHTTVRAGGRIFRADSEAGAIRVEGERAIDVSKIADPRRQRDAGRLREGDRPGTVTLAIDDGPEYCWKSGEDAGGDLPQTFRVRRGKHRLVVRARGPRAQLEGIEARIAP